MAEHDDQFPDAAEVLFRQVYPNWLTEDGQPSSQAFYPWREVDKGCLSVDRSTLTTPAEAHALFTAPKPAGFEQASAGVWGLSITEVVEVGIAPRPDRIDATHEYPENPAHALLEYPSANPKGWKGLGRRLKVKAADRGCLHPKDER